MAKGCKTGGRVKGTPNKTTDTVKNILIETFDRLGGVETLSAWARENQTEFYKLWIKLLPHDVKTSIEVREEVTEIPDPIESARKIAFVLNKFKDVNLHSS